MSLSRIIAIENKFTTGTPAEFTVRMPSLGFVPTSYKVLNILYGITSNGATYVVSHDRLGVLGSFQTGTGSNIINARISNRDEIDLHSGAISTFTITRAGARETALNANICILIECSRRIPPLLVPTPGR